MSLLQIQQALKVPKGQKNTFGGYQYRSCEDILEALKPCLDDSECVLVITDDVIDVGGRIYIKATCTLSDSTRGVIATNQAFAREPLSKKGMDESQITGTASSYARKYALNGMFLIDDTKDADSNEQAEELKKPRVPHDKHLEKEMLAMSKAESIDRLKILARDATNYFNDWNQTECAASIRAAYTANSSKFATPEEAAE